MPTMLSYDEMKAVIERGGVMQMPDGRTIHRVADLPDPADIAVASEDAGSRAIVRAELERKQAELKAQLDKLNVAESAEKSASAAKGQAEAAARADDKKAGEIGPSPLKPHAADPVKVEPAKAEPKAADKKDK